MSFLLTYRNVQISFGDRELLAQPLSFEITAGQHTVVLGASGSGKSLLLSLLLPATTSPTYTWCGEIYLQGKQIHRGERATQQVGYVPQNIHSALYPLLTIRDHVILFARQKHLDATGCMDEFRETLQQLAFDQPDQVLNYYPYQLSGGMKQRIVLALAMLGQPQLLIADECASQLDPEGQQAVMRLLHTLCQSHRATLLYASHQRRLVQGLARQQVILPAGSLGDHAASASTAYW